MFFQFRSLSLYATHWLGHELVLECNNKVYNYACLPLPVLLSLECCGRWGGYQYSCGVLQRATDSEQQQKKQLMSGKEGSWVDLRGSSCSIHFDMHTHRMWILQLCYCAAVSIVHSLLVLCPMRFVTSSSHAPILYSCIYIYI